MKKITLLLVFMLSMHAAFAVSHASLNGQLSSGTGSSVANKQIKYRIGCYAYNSITSLFHVDSGYFNTDSTGTYSVNLSFPTSFKAHVLLSVADCDNIMMNGLDSVDNSDSSISWSPSICATIKFVFGGTMLNSDNTPAGGQPLAYRVDSSATSNYEYDSAMTNSSGAWTDVITLKRGWRSGWVVLYFGCSGQTSTKTYPYTVTWYGSELKAIISTGPMTYCVNPRAVFQGQITNSSSNPVAGHTFTIRIDSINLNGDSMIRTVTTKSDGTFKDSVTMGIGMTMSRFTYRVPDCTTTQYTSGTAQVIMNRAVSTQNFTTCGQVDWHASVTFFLYQKGNSGSSTSIPYVIHLHDSTHNYRDTFWRMKPAGTTITYATFDVPYFVDTAEIYVEYEGCLATEHIGNYVIMKNGSKNAFWNQYYYYCGSSLPAYSFKVYPYFQGVNDPRNGTGYLIKSDTTMNGTGIDTILSLQDSVIVNGDSFVFSNVPLGWYRIKFAASSSDPDYNDIVTCYHDTDIYWRDADPVLIDTVASMNMRLLQGTNTGGPGFISGSLSSGANKTGNPISNITIIVFDQNMKVIRSVTTNSTGAYSVTNLPLGKVYLLVDVPGRSATPAELTISGTTHTITDVNFLVHKKYIEAKLPTGINAVKLKSLKVYPNPAKEQLHIEFGSSSSYRITIYDLQGREVLTQMMSGSTGSINLSNLPRDSYLIKSHNILSNEITLNKIILN